MGRPRKDPVGNLYKFMKEAFEEAIKDPNKLPFDAVWLLYKQIEEAERQGQLNLLQALKLKAQLAPKLKTDHYEMLSRLSDYSKLLKETGFLDFYSKLNDHPAWDDKGGE